MYKSKEEIQIILSSILHEQSKTEREIKMSIAVNQAGLDAIATVLLFAAIAGKAMDSIACTSIPLIGAIALYTYSLSLSR